MNIERTQYAGHHGVIFSLIHFTVEPSDATSLRTLKLPEITDNHYKVIRLIEDMYDKMLVQGRSCKMMLGISNPLSRKVADDLNDQRVNIARIVGTAIGAAAKPFLGGIPSAAIGAGAGKLTIGKIPTHHFGDVIVFIDAQVNGGIGPQHSSSSLIIEGKSNSRE
jgi:hypothetical protein